MADFEIRGVQDMIRRLGATKAQVHDACGEGLFRFGSKIMSISRAEYVPYDTHTLQRSGKTDEPEWSGDTVTVLLHYGDDARAYALIQHERTDFHHPHGQAKYLETPVKRFGTQQGVNTYLAPPIRRALNRGVLGNA